MKKYILKRSIYFRPQSWNRESQFLMDTEDNHLNLVILGNEGLADQLAKEIRVSVVHLIN